MTLDTRISPFYDDFDEDKNFHRILFKPGSVVQARELTQSQTILQNQIKRVGEYLFKDGDKVNGPKPSVNLDARTIRLRDTDLRGNRVNVKNLLNTFVTSSELDIIGQVEFAYEKDDPDIGDELSIVISLKKFNSENEGLFPEGTELLFYVDYTDSLNKGRPNFTAVVSNDVVRSSFGSIKQFSQEIVLNSPNPNIQLGDILIHPLLEKKIYVTEIRSSLQLVVSDYPDVNIGNDRIEFRKLACCPTIIVLQDNATFFKDGFLIRNTVQKIVPNKNTAFPSKLIGFYVSQNLITSNDDSSLLDPAVGSENYFAPGADRLQIKLDIVSFNLDQESRVSQEDNFIPLVKFNKGKIEYIKEQFSTEGTLDKKLAERTYDESGNYVVDPFLLNPVESDEENPNLVFSVSAGKAYVGGYQIKTIGPTEISTAKTTSTDIIEDYNVNTTQGNFIKLTNLQYGIPKFNEFQGGTIPMFVEVHSVKNPTDTSTRVGFATLRNIEYFSHVQGNTIYKGFWHSYAPEIEAPATWSEWSERFGIPENEGRQISEEFYESNKSLGSFQIGDTAEREYFTLYREPDVYGVVYWWKRWVEGYNRTFPPGFKIEFINGAVGEDIPRLTTPTAGKQFIQSQNNSVFFDGFIQASNLQSIVTVSIPDSPTFKFPTRSYDNPFFYAEIPTEGRTDRDSIITFDQSFYNTLVFDTGKTFVKSIKKIQTEYTKVLQNITFSQGSYTTSLSAPESFPVGDGPIALSVARRLFPLVITSGGTTNVPGGQYEYGASASVTVSGSNRILTINTGDTSFNGTADLLLTIENDDLQPRIKTLIKNFAKTVNINAAEVPVNLGKCDILEFKGIYKINNVNAFVGSWNDSAQYTIGNIVNFNGGLYLAEKFNSNTTPSSNVWTPLISEPFQNFVLFNGQRDTFYGPGNITYIAPGSPPGNVIVTFDYFTHSGEGPATVDSYPEEIYSRIPTYKSTTAKEYNLRDCIDFRPRIKDDSDAVEGQLGIFPTSVVNTECNIEYYLGRFDRLYAVNSVQNYESPYNRFYIVKGEESINPIPPEDLTDVTKMSICVLELPPYTKSAFDVIVRYDDNRRFTMRDIGRIEASTKKLERTVRLHAIEIIALKSAILDDTGTFELLKTGILVEDFSDLEKADIEGVGFSTIIDINEQECYPSFSGYNLDLDFVSTSNDVLVFNDIIMPRYEEEIFLSQIETNSIISVNPAGINDRQGRATISRKNSFSVNLLSSGGILAANSLELKAAGSFISGSSGSSGAATFSSSRFLGDEINQATISAEVVTAIAWKATRDLRLPFFNAIRAIDGIVTLFGQSFSNFMDVRSAIVNYIGGGNSILIPAIFDEDNIPLNITNSTLTNIVRTLNYINGTSNAATIVGLAGGLNYLVNKVSVGTYIELAKIASQLGITLTGVPLIGTITQSITADIYVPPPPPTRRKRRRGLFKALLVIAAVVAIVYFAPVAGPLQGSFQPGFIPVA